MYYKDRGCSFPKCDNRHAATGYCSGHYSQVRNGKPLSKLKSQSKVDKTLDCIIDTCTAKRHIKDMCHPHYDQMRLYGEINDNRAINYAKDNVICKGPECKRTAAAKGLCSSHWMQYSRHQKLTKITKDRKTLIQVFEESILRGPNKDDCWLWISAGSGKGYKRDDPSSGYGQLRAEGESYMAHRWSYEHYRDWHLLPGDTLDHLCRVTRCCNPEHLEIVSHSENVGRRNLYMQLRSENDRYRDFILKLGYDPDLVLQDLVEVRE